MSRQPRAFRRSLVRTVMVLFWSVAVWVALWGSISAANVVWGAVLGAFTLIAVPAKGAPRIPVRVVPLARFALLFLVALIKASGIVAWEVVTPTSRINEGIVEVPLRTRSRGVMTLLGNAVSLTPGTLTLEVRPDPPTLYVHVLHLRDIEDVRREIRHWEDIVLAAFRPESEEEPTGVSP